MTLDNMRFGRLTVLYRTADRVLPSGKHEVMYECVCDCGNHKAVRLSSLRNGNTKSCGCYRNECSSARRTRHGMSDSKLYGVWNSMKDRCESISNRSYPLYGGRGIKVCSDWHDASVFIQWALSNGYREGLTLDRIDGNGDYCPDNCRWVDHIVQNNNTSRNHLLFHDGRSQTIAEWSRETGIPYGTIKSRVNKYGWSADDALNRQ